MSVPNEHWLRTLELNGRNTYPSDFTASGNLRVSKPWGAAALTPDQSGSLVADSP